MELDSSLFFGLAVQAYERTLVSERTPFDPPQLFVPDGHPGDATAVAGREAAQACDERLTVPPIGRKDRRTAGLPPLEPFLGGAEAD